jgi:serine phosphatase RsbU (regulator of sigma subunit)
MAAKEFYSGWTPGPPIAVAAAMQQVETAAERSARLAQEQLTTLRSEMGEVYRELYEAAQMQRKLSGPRHLRRGDFEIASEMFPVRHISGDFFNVSDVGANTMLAIGYIAGKGLTAGMWFTHLLALMRTHAEADADPAAAMQAINRQICTLRSGPPITSMFVARLDWRTGTLEYCNAGHPGPLLLRAKGGVETLQQGGPLLGVLPDASFENGRVVLEPGDLLLGYSDGLIESCNQRDEEFGVDRLLAAALGAERASANAMLFSVVGAVQDFAGGHPREDDFTLIVVHRSGGME